MPYFHEEEARSIIRDRYGHVRSDGTAVAEAFYALEEIPLPDATADVVISNGVLNLSTRKSRVLAETMRLLRPGGRVSLSDLVLATVMPVQRHEELVFSVVVTARKPSA